MIHTDGRNTIANRVATRKVLPDGAIMVKLPAKVRAEQLEARRVIAAAESITREAAE